MPEKRKKNLFERFNFSGESPPVGGGRYVGGSIEGEGVGPRLKKGGGGRLEKVMI